MKKEKKTENGNRNRKNRKMYKAASERGLGLSKDFAL